MMSLLVIGGSAGSLDTLLQLLPALPADWQPAMIIVLHRKNDNDALLTSLLAAKTVLPVKEVEEKDVLLPGHIYLVPSDYHLLIEPDYSLTLDDSEKVNFSRPSIDVTMMSAAGVFGEQLTCLLLSGANSDGVEGLRVAKQLGAHTMAIDPKEAVVDFMPKQAIRSNVIQRVLTVSEIISTVKMLK
jgi:two-component system, chemotaxis family, protein-glutamate methylesterase/glutaminase